jgi:hypothetical protein
MTRKSPNGTALHSKPLRDLMPTIVILPVLGLMRTYKQATKSPVCPKAAMAGIHR